jgi:ankyrin repeat protein
MAFDLPRQLEQRKTKKQLLTEEECSLLRARYPFAEYATTYILHHANQAGAGVCQRRFMADDLTVSDWVTKFNAFQQSKPVVYSDRPSLWYLCAEKNFARLMTRPTEALSPEPKQKYGTPLIAAIVHSSWEVLKIFLDDMNVLKIDETIAEVRSKAKLVLLPREWLVVPWRWAVMNDLEYLSKHFLTSAPEKERNEMGDFVLREALTTGHEKRVRMMIDAGADIDTHRRAESLLYLAALYGHEKVMQMLIDAGADLNAQGRWGNGSPLGSASERGDETTVQFLIDAGADVNAEPDHRSPLIKTSRRGHERVVQILIDAGADVNAKRDEDSCALLSASGNGHEKVVKILIDAGADVTARGDKYDNALQVASTKGHEKVVQMLIDIGVDVNAQGGRNGTAL